MWDILEYFPEMAQIETLLATNAPPEAFWAVVGPQFRLYGGQSRVRNMPRGSLGILVNRAVRTAHTHSPQYTGLTDTIAREHCHDYIEIIYVYAGSVHQSIDGKELLLKRSQVCLLNSNTWHVEKDVGDEDIIHFIGISKANFKKFCTQLGQAEAMRAEKFLGDTTVRQVVFSLPDDTVTRGTVTALCEEFCRKRPGYEYIVKGLCFRFLEGIFSTGLPQMLQPVAIKKSERNFIELETYVKEHLPSATRNALAELFHFSPGYVNYLYKTHCGKNFTAHLQDLRIEQAAHLLRDTNLDVGTIIEAVGYANRNHFYRLFRARYSVSPTEFRHI